jgi:ribokinase
MSAPLAVIGAINVDLVIRDAPLPRPGETVVGGTFETHHGGKGGNQAVAAARAGAPVVLLGAVGDDEHAEAALAALEREHVDVSRVRTVSDVATGVALIAVDAAGDNQISVAPGANHHVGDVTDDLDGVRPSIVLASCEVDRPALESAAAWCVSNHVALVLNPAPADPSLGGLIASAAVATPNAAELRALEDAAGPVTARYPTVPLVITLGGDGARIVTEGTEELVPAPAVTVVDTTGAGDCLNGVLAAGLHSGLSLAQATRRAVVAASISTTVSGAREGMPTAERIDAAVAAGSPSGEPSADR